MNSLERIWIVFSKEVSDNLRDRRSLASSLFSALIGPLITLGLIVVLGNTLFKDIIEDTLVLPVAGAENAPMLIEFLQQHNVSIIPAPDDPKEAARNGDVNLVLVIGEDYADDFREGRPANVQIVADSSRQSAMPDTERARSLLEAYSGQIGSLRLLVRGISPAVVNPISVERVDVSTPQTQALLFLNMMPYFVVLVVFTGGMHVVIDTTAGERERGSLEPLLINPVSRRDFVLGKLLASIPFSAAIVALTLVAFAAAFNLFPIEDYIGFQMSIDPLALGGIFLIAVPMMLLASAILMIVASFTRTFKEAQTYTAFIPLIPAIPGMLLAFVPVKPSIALMMIPTFGQQLLINQLMRGEALDTTLVIVSTVVTLLLSVVLIAFAVHLYQRERIIFGGR